MKSFARVTFFTSLVVSGLGACASGQVERADPSTAAQKVPASAAPVAPGTPATPSPTAPSITTPATVPAGTAPTTLPPATTPAPAAGPVADGNAVSNPNHEVNFGKPDPAVVYDANAKRGFDPNLLYTANDNGYPGCDNPVQIDFGFNAPPAGCPAQPVGTQLPMQSHCHINYNTPINYYGSNPPASGDHWPDPSHALGVNTTAVPREYYVHSMEHGAVILAYNCPDGCDYEIGIMAKAVAARSDRSFKVLMTPDPRMAPNTFAAISWTWLYTFAEPDYTKLVCFIDEHYNHARENDKVL